MGNEHPILFNGEMVSAILDGRKTQTRRVIKESFVYGLTDDRIHGILTDVNVITKETCDVESNYEADTSFAEPGLRSWLRWTNLLSDEIQRLWEKGVRGLVSVKRTPAKGQGLQKRVSVPRQQEGYKVYTSSCMYGLSRDAGKRIYAGEAFGWEPCEQQARKLKMGNPNRKLAGSEGSRKGLRGREASNGKADRRRMSTLTVGNQTWDMQPATGSKSLGHVSGWHLAYSKYQINSVLWVRETHWLSMCKRYVAFPGGSRNKYQLPPDSVCDEHSSTTDILSSGRRFQLQDGGIVHAGSPIAAKNEKEVLNCVVRLNDARQDLYFHRKPSIHMPKWACRLWLKVKSVRVERLQEITACDIEAEGIDITTEDGMRTKNAFRGDCWELWQTLWDSINKARGFGWDVNPWVWVLEFERSNSNE